MNILLSPAKKMRRDPDSLAPWSTPALLPQTKELLSRLQSLSPQELQALWGCNDTIAAQNVERLQNMELDRQLTPAVLSYDGIAYQHMAPGVFEDSGFSYVQEHLKILSGFYGVLRPMDGVQPYRLEMQAKLSVNGSRDLYDFWGRTLYEQVKSPDGILLNLASKEYSRCIAPYLTEHDRMVTCLFTQMVKGKPVQKATLAKMARGEMVRFLAEVQADSPETAKEFTGLGFVFRPDLSSDTAYLFEHRSAKLL